MTRSLPLLTVVLALLLVGCGSSDNGVASKPASQILAATRSAVRGANAVRIVSRSSVGRAKSTFDASLAKGQGRAHVSLLGTDLEAIRVGGALYVKADRASAARLASVLRVEFPANTWVRGPTKGLFGQVGAFTNIETEVSLILSGSGPVSKGAEIKVNGQPAIALKETRKLYTGTLYVATAGQPYPIKLVKKGRETGQTTFTGWSDPVTVSPPAKSVDISRLEHTKKGH
jgi:hypothetical protein